MVRNLPESGSGKITTFLFNSANKIHACCVYNLCNPKPIKTNALGHMDSQMGGTVWTVWLVHFKENWRQASCFYSWDLDS